MARPNLSASTTNRDKWNNDTNWNNSAGDWWDKTATAQGSTAWQSKTITDNDTARSETFDVTEWAQAVYDNADWTSAVLLRGTGGSINIAMLADGTASNRPKISYDGGAVEYATDTVSISAGSFGGTDGASFTPLALSQADGERILIEFPAPSTRPTSATMTLYTTAQFGDTTVSVFWLRYPPESSPSLLGPPTYLRPSSDISNTGWTPSTGPDLYAMLDEPTSSRSDYISASAAGAVTVLGHTPIINQPTAGTDIEIGYDAEGINSTESIRIELLEGATVRYTSATIPLSTAAVGTLTVTPATWAGMAAWPWAVRVRVTTL